jgi:hypothetical protein
MSMRREKAERAPAVQTIRSAMVALGYTIPEQGFLHSVDQRSFFWLSVFMVSEKGGSILTFSFDREGRENYRYVQPGKNSTWFDTCYVRDEDQHHFAQAKKNRIR